MRTVNFADVDLDKVFDVPVKDSLLTITKDGNGVIRYFNHEGNLHRTEGPAIIFPDGGRVYMQHGFKHRRDGAAHITANGNRRYYIKGDKVICRGVDATSKPNLPDTDYLGRFLDEVGMQPAGDPRYEQIVSTAAIHKRYQAWCKENGIRKILTDAVLGRQLTKRGFERRATEHQSLRVVYLASKEK